MLCHGKDFKANLEVLESTDRKINSHVNLKVIESTNQKINDLAGRVDKEFRVLEGFKTSQDRKNKELSARLDVLET